MKLFRNFGIIFLSLQGIFCFTFAQQKAVIIGVVRDAVTKEKLTGVTVYENDSSATSTDSSGRYELNLEEGTHAISYRFIGYEIQSKTIVLKSAEARIINIDLVSSMKELGTVVVSAGKFEQKIEDVTVSMEVLKPDLVENTNTTSMDDIINQVPGVTVIDGQANIRGGSGFSYGAGARLLMLVDDLPMIAADANDVKWSFLPTENLEQIEVLKGASSALFGSSAMNGVINIRTAYPKSEPATEVSLFDGIYDSPKNKMYKWWEGNSQEMRGMSASHSQKFGRFDLVAAGNYFKDDGFREGENEERVRVNANTRYSFKNALEGLSVGVNANYYHTNGGLFLIWKNDSNALIPYGGINPDSTTISDYTTIRFNVDPFVTYVSKNGETHKIRTRYFKTDNNNNTDQESFAKLYYGEYQFQKRFNENLTWTSGVVDMYSDVVSDTLYGNHHSNNIALFTQVDNKFNKWVFSFGARWEQNRIDTVKGDFTPVFRSGINYELFPHTHLRVSYGQGYRFPSIAEKFIKTNVGPVVVYPNDSLQPETGFTAEFGINQGMKISAWKGSFDVAAFWSEYKDMMEFTFGLYGNPFVDPLFGLGFKSLNIGNVRIQGLDFTFTGSGKIGKVPLNVLSGFTLIYPIQTDFVTADTGNGTAGYNILKYRHRRELKADVEAKPGKFTIGVSTRYNSFMENIDYAFNSLIPGVAHYREIHNTGDWVFDGRIFYSFLKYCEIGLIVKNVFNRDYMDRPANLQPPRTFIVQARVKF